MHLKHLMSAMLAGSMLVLPGVSLAADVTAARLSAAGSEAEAGNWLMVHRTYDAPRYSPLGGHISRKCQARQDQHAARQHGGQKVFQAHSLPLFKDRFLR